MGTQAPSVDKPKIATGEGGRKEEGNEIVESVDSISRI